MDEWTLVYIVLQACTGLHDHLGNVLESYLYHLYKYSTSAVGLYHWSEIVDIVYHLFASRL